MNSYDFSPQSLSKKLPLVFRQGIACRSGLNGLQDGLNIRKHRLALEVLLSGNHPVRTATFGAHEFQKSQKAVDCFANSRVDYENI
jgi:hypothetical protein